MTSATTPTTSTPAPTRHGALDRVRAFANAVWRGKVTDAAWVRPALLGLLTITAVLYLWNLSINGYANSFYSAAVQAGSLDWKAFFFGSSDMGNSITVDKPPASLWVMALSVRLFGLNSWAILAPQAIMGVITVGLVYAIVRRHFSAVAALSAGFITALTPVATLMFRFNNPDALLLLLLTASAYWTVRALEDGRTRWLIFAGIAVGFGFLTKQLQAFLILPSLAGVFLAFGPGRFLRRLWQSLAALGAVIVSAGWWVAIVELWPADSRPFIGGSQNNSFLELTFGYNGLGRLTGAETGSVTGGVGGPGGSATSQWGETGITRLFTSEFASQIGWMLPAALVLAAVGIFLTLTRPRTDVRRSLLVLATGWLITTWLAFSFMAGIFHAYYTVALAPSIAIVVAVVGNMLWGRRAQLWARITAAAVVAGSGALACSLLLQSNGFLPWLTWVVAGATAVASVAIVALPLRSWILSVAAVATTVALLAGPTAYSIDTVATPHTGSIVTAGPVTSTRGAGGRMDGDQGKDAGGAPGGTTTGNPGGTMPGGTTTGAPGGSGTAPGGTMPPGAMGGPGAQNGQAGNTGNTGNVSPGTPQGGGMGGGAGSLLGSTTVSDTLTTLLQANAISFTWVGATTGAVSAASFQLATGYAVMPIGGFNGSDPSPTLDEFKAYVAEGKIHYYIASGVGGQSNGGSEAATEIATWVSENYTATTVDGTTLYDLSAGS